VELTRLNCSGQFKPFVYLNDAATGPRYPSLRATDAARCPLFWRGLAVLLVASGPAFGSADPDRVSGPDGWDPAAGPASIRHPAADRASDRGSDSAGPVSGSGGTSGSPWLNVREDAVCHNLKARRLVSGELGSCEVIAWRPVVATVAGGTPRRTTSAQDRSSRTSRCCRTGFPLLENNRRAVRLPGPSPRHPDSDPNSGSAWTISPSNSSTASCSVRSMA
jgi:hypothetical protein